MECVVVHAARIGNGIFATRRFRAGETVFRVRGTVVHYTEVNRRGGTYQDNTFRFGRETYLSPEGEIGDFLNHSCAPNAKVEKRGRRLFVVAIRMIPVDTEVVIDYSTILAGDDTWTMRCRCGMPECRFNISAFTQLPVRLQDSYRRRRIVPEYILRLSPYFIYILRCADDSFYTGITTDVIRRFEEHVSGAGAAYTRTHKPRAIVYTEEAVDRSAALKREAQLKKLTKTQKSAIIARYAHR